MPDSRSKGPNRVDPLSTFHFETIDLPTLLQLALFLGFLPTYITYAQWRSKPFSIIYLDPHRQHRDMTIRYYTPGCLNLIGRAVFPQRHGTSFDYHE